jgi:glyoxylase-like metal-dependent hydrolase (beta-lactamase superfamily II)
LAFSIQLLPVGRVECPGPEIFWMDNWDEWLPCTMQVALIQGDGACVLVNTGPPEDLAPMNAYWASKMGERVKLKREEGEYILDALAARNISPDDVTHIILTPLGNPNVANVDRFPHAQVCISKRGWLHFHTTHSRPRYNRANELPDAILVHLITDAWPRVKLLEDEDTLVPGIRTWWAGTHNRATVVVEVDTAHGVVALSDAYMYLENVVDDRPLGIAESIEEGIRAYARVRATADHVIPLMDPRNFDRFPGGVVA